VETEEWVIGGTIAAVFIGLITFVIIMATSSSARAEERKVMEGPRNKVMQELMEGKRVERYWQPTPPKGDIYIEMDDGTMVKFHSSASIEVYEVKGDE